MTRRLSPFLLAICTAAHLILPSPAGAQDRGACTRGLVDSIEVVRHSIFEASEVSTRRFAWVYGLVNRLHIATHPDLIRSEIVVREGDCFDPRAMEESVRLLRDFPFLARVEGESIERADGSRTLRFTTWDEWTTAVGLNVSIEDEIRFEGAFMTESNLLGRGLTLRLVSERRRELRNLGVAVGAPRLLGTRLDGSIGAGTTRDGTFVSPAIAWPFVGEAGRTSVEFRGDRRDHDRVFATGGLEGSTHILTPVTDYEVDLSWDRRWGPPGRIRSLGLEARLRHARVTGAPTMAARNNFDALPAAPASLVEGLGAFSDPPSEIRLGVVGGVRRIDFVTRRGLDLVTGEQDVAVGLDASVTAGRAIGGWNGSVSDSYLRAEGFLGAASDRVAGQLRLRLEGRTPDARESGAPRTEDVLARIEGIGFGRTGAHTLYAQLQYEGVWRETGRRMDGVRQRTLGGAGGVRSFVDYEVPVARLLMLRVEERWNPEWFGPALDLGLTLFGDLGRGWSGATPYTQTTPWQSAAGVGLRIGFPAGSGSVLRAEWATAAGGGLTEGGVFRAYWVTGTTGR